MRWIICRRCDKAVPPEYIQTHLDSKHNIYCSDETFNSIIIGRRLMSLDSITAWKKDTVALDMFIGGISIERGYSRIECGHCIPV